MSQEYEFDLNVVEAFEFNRKLLEDLDRSRTNNVFIYRVEEMLVDFGSDINPDTLNYIISNNIKSKTHRKTGGTVVLTPEDMVVITMFKEGENHEELVPFLTNNLSNFFSEVCKETGHEFSRDRNDFLIDGFKAGSFLYGESYHLVLFNFSMNKEKLAPFCLSKTMVKEPKGITEITGRTKEDLIEYLEKVFIYREFI